MLDTDYLKNLKLHQNWTDINICYGSIKMGQSLDTEFLWTLGRHKMSMFLFQLRGNINMLIAGG